MNPLDPSWSHDKSPVKFVTLTVVFTFFFFLVPWFLWSCEQMSDSPLYSSVSYRNKLESIFVHVACWVLKVTKRVQEPTTSSVVLITKLNPKIYIKWRIRLNVCSSDTYYSYLTLVKLHSPYFLSYKLRLHRSYN